ncbi:chromosome segregation in meiosis-related protein [Oleoguttula sp. CCFEE 5521]
MPTAVQPNPRAGASTLDELDNLLDYDNAVQDFWKDLPDAGNRNADEPVQQQRDMDEEIVVTKRRKPNPKLDDARLLSSAGIPKLRRISKDRLKFKGKGHEFSDISRMLNSYQLWLDDLYPKAKFRDALAMVEKLGHSKRMQVSRRAWMEESKASQRGDDGQFGDADADGGAGASGDVPGGTEPIFPDQDLNVSLAGQAGRSPGNDLEDPPDDELDALLAEHAHDVQHGARGQQPQSVHRGPFEDDDEPDEDELDALMAEATDYGSSVGARPAVTKTLVEDDNDFDDLDALMAEEAQQSRVQQEVENDFADEEEVLASM